MRIILFAFLVSLLAVSCSSEAPPPPPAPVTVDLAAESAAIKTIILDQTKAFVARDVDGMVAYHTDPAQVIQNVFGQTDILSATMPHDVMKGALRDYFNSVPPSDVRTDEVITDWNIRLSDDGSMAWATYKSKIERTNDFFTNEEIRILEKVDGEWKLALVSTLIGPMEEKASK